MTILRRFLLILPLILAACATPAPKTHVGEGLTPDYSRSKPEVQKFMKMGEQAAATGNAQTAAMLYHAASVNAPTDPAPQLALAQLYEASGNYAAAAAAYELLGKSSMLDEDSQLSVKLAAARAYLKGKDYKIAAERYESLANSSGDWRAYNGLGVVRDL